MKRAGTYHVFLSSARGRCARELCRSRPEGLQFAANSAVEQPCIVLKIVGDLRTSSRPRTDPTSTDRWALSLHRSWGDPRIDRSRRLLRRWRRRYRWCDPELELKASMAIIARGPKHPRSVLAAVGLTRATAGRPPGSMSRTAHGGWLGSPGSTRREWT